MLKEKRSEGTGSRVGKKAITRCKKFTDLDFARALPKIQISPKLYNIYREEQGGNEPGISTCYKRFSFIHVIPGWITAIFLYLEMKVPTWEAWQCIASMTFDEVCAHHMFSRIMNLLFVVFFHKKYHLCNISYIAT